MQEVFTIAYVTIPKDLSRAQSKVLFGLTKRQVICFGAAALNPDWVEWLKLSSLLDEADFQRVYRKIKAGRPRWSSVSPKSAGPTSHQRNRTARPKNWWNAFWLLHLPTGRCRFP